MANPSKRRGSDFEKQLADYLAAELDLPVERRVQGGTNDRGDLAGIKGWTVEAKAERGMDLAGAMNEAKKENANAGTARYCAVFKRRNHNISEAYAVLPLWLLAKLIKETL